MSRHTSKHSTMPRLHCAGQLGADNILTINDQQAHYLRHVLRLHDGDIVRVFNQHHGEWLGVIAIAGKRGVTIRITEQTRPPEPIKSLWLCAAPIKKAHFDYMIEKATELGISDFQPVLTSRTQIRDVNIERCTSIATEAAEQSERLSLPRAHAVTDLESMLAEWPQGHILIVCAEWGDAAPISEALMRLNITPATPAAILTGPEGGFTAEELELLRQKAFAHFVRLGPRILRADTAAVSALAIWQASCGDWTSSKQSVR